MADISYGIELTSVKYVWLHISFDVPCGFGPHGSRWQGVEKGINCWFVNS